MKPTYQNLWIFLFIFLFSFASCRKDNLSLLAETDKNPCWELHPEVELDRRLLIYGLAKGDFIYLLSNNYFLKMDESGLLEDRFISELGNISLYDYPMLNDKLFAIGLDRYSLEKLEIFSTQNPSISGTIDPHAIDSNFQKINYFSGNGMCVNDDNKLLFSVRKKFIPDAPDPYLYFWMFDFILENDKLIFEFDKEIKIEIPGSGNTSDQKVVSEMVVFENEFYCSIMSPSKTYKINTEGKHKELFPLRDVKIFELNDTLFALGHTRECNIAYAIKPPQSDSWDAYSLGEYTGCSSNFYQIDKRFIIVRNNQLWELKINHSNWSFEILELDENCLQSTSIRSMFEFKDKVYLATPEGLYLKGREDFFIYKEE